MKDQLPNQQSIPGIGIINLDDNTGTGIHWVAYAIHQRSLIYFDSYGLTPPKEFHKYVSSLRPPVWYSTLPTQTLADLPICGREVLIVLTAISESSKRPHKTV